MADTPRTRLAVVPKPPAPLSVSVGTAALILVAAVLVVVPIVWVVDISSDLLAYGQPDYYRGRLLGAIAASVAGLLLAGASVYLIAANQAGRRWAWSAMRVLSALIGFAALFGPIGLVFVPDNDEELQIFSMLALGLLCPILWGVAFAYGRRPAMRHFGLIGEGSASGPAAR